MRDHSQLGVLAQRAHAKLREGRPHEAAALLIPVAQDPGSGADRSAPLQLALGRSLAMLGQIERGAQAIGRACELAPGQAPALTELAVLLGRLGRFEEALSRVREARTINPTLAAAAFQEAELLTDLRRDDEALGVVESFERVLGAQAREPAAQARFLPPRRNGTSASVPSSPSRGDSSASRRNFNDWPDHETSGRAAKVADVARIVSRNRSGRTA